MILLRDTWNGLHSANPDGRLLRAWIDGVRNLTARVLNFLMRVVEGVGRVKACSPALLLLAGVFLSTAAQAQQCATDTVTMTTSAGTTSGTLDATGNSTDPCVTEPSSATGAIGIINGLFTTNITDVNNGGGSPFLPMVGSSSTVLQTANITLSNGAVLHVVPTDPAGDPVAFADNFFYTFTVVTPGSTSSGTYSFHVVSDLAVENFFLGSTTTLPTDATITITFNGLPSTAAPTSVTTLSPAAIDSGGTATMTVTLTNPNAASISGVADSITLPTGVVVAATPSASTTCTSATFSPSAGATSLSLSGGTMTASPATCRFQVAITSSSLGGSPYT